MQTRMTGNDSHGHQPGSPKVLEIYTASMRAEIISGCSDALQHQSLATDEIVSNNLTSERMKQVLGAPAQRRCATGAMGPMLFDEATLKRWEDKGYVKRYRSA